MRKWYPALLIALSVIASAIVYPQLPERVPTHWNLRGEINGYGSRWVTTLLFPLLLIAMWGLFRVLPKIDPRRANFAKMEGAYTLVVNASLTVIAVIHFLVIAATLGAPVPSTRLAPPLFGLLLVVIGNQLPRARPNWWFGIRTPWTLSNDRVWERTHRVGGYFLLGAGLVTIAGVAFPPSIGMPLGAICASTAAIAALVYSYIAWRQETSR